MSHLHLMLPADIWMQKIFDAKAAREGGVVRRSTRDVERIVGRSRFLNEVQRRGYHAVENSGQIVIFCNNDRVQVLC
ncbi:N-(5'-phosphoribosyl)anthranilate isomerase [Roseovarius rhodophyticola]|uniref:N-(5'-phosphoribosyl)anthranilate isomerase n=1 Tax=Roseovarius rhodophyticola TaxID=3080827 RepID=A0ABZ2TEC8_9RHOB|nr:N-(5'-phosphoribosyl)anthranilate isomerase [Roseovarius sp. W115]MDV2928321.1 N-(5'-phosphoribosyl)anthranilate isomerase [Roseovarius sp. W115]